MRILGWSGLPLIMQMYSPPLITISPSTPPPFSLTHPPKTVSFQGSDVSVGCVSLVPFRILKLLSALWTSGVLNFFPLKNLGKYKLCLKGS